MPAETLLLEQTNLHVQDNLPDRAEMPAESSLPGKKRIILDLCGGTGAWSRPYSERPDEYEVVNVTLPRFDVRRIMTCLDDDDELLISFQAMDGGRGRSVRVREVHGILAAPPCTEFSRAKKAGTNDFAKGFELVRACLEIIWICQLRGNLKWWAMENPEGHLRKLMGHPPFSFEPWWFGDEWTKQTDIWGYFERPRRSVVGRPSKLRSKLSTLTRQGVHVVNPEGSGMSNRAAARSITPSGFANAFARAND